jgi:hypothetical protein
MKVFFFNYKKDTGIDQIQSSQVGKEHVFIHKS